MVVGEYIHMHQDELPKLPKRVTSYPGSAEKQAVYASVTMIFRAFCWHHYHRLNLSKKVLAFEWRRSEMPVFYRLRA
jgi:hypothetical protein